MGDKLVLQASPTQALAAVDANGMVTLQHVAAGPYLKFDDGTAGELLLCGAAIKYSSFKGAAPGAPKCSECARLDA
jgi:hypothetical protein